MAKRVLSRGYGPTSKQACARRIRSERALAALRGLAQPSARVIRGGVELIAPARELAPGDIVLIEEGERMVADALLVGGDVLSVYESTLTDESAPAVKRIFSGTLVVRGQGVARVSRTGAKIGPRRHRSLARRHRLRTEAAAEGGGGAGREIANNPYSRRARRASTARFPGVALNSYSPLPTARLARQRQV